MGACIPGYDRILITTKLWDGDLEKWKKLGQRSFRTERFARVKYGISLLNLPGNRQSLALYSWSITIKCPTAGILIRLFVRIRAENKGLPAWGVCNLSAINLSKFYDAEKHDVDWDELA